MCRGVLGPARPIAERTEHDVMLEATGAVVARPAAAATVATAAT
jgi:hypothetical protein